MCLPNMMSQKDEGTTPHGARLKSSKSEDISCVSLVGVFSGPQCWETSNALPMLDLERVPAREQIKNLIRAHSNEAASP